MVRRWSTRALINGLPGFVTREADGELQTTALEVEDGKVTGIYVMRNPGQAQAYALTAVSMQSTRRCSENCLAINWFLTLLLCT
jgi:hypothetical protein